MSSYIKISKHLEDADLQYSNEALLHSLGELCDDTYDVCTLDINCRNIYGPSSHQDWEVSFFDDSKRYYQDFATYIDEEHKKQKNVVVCLELDYYGTMIEPQTGYNQEVSHRVSLFLRYTQHGYEMYYINGHGFDVVDYKSYEMYITKRRKKFVSSKGQCVDYDIIHLILDELKQCESTKILFKFTTKYVYSGQNLQEYDDHGVCYIIPFIVLIALRQRHRQSADLNITSIVEHVAGKLIWESENEKSLLKKGEVIENKQYTPHISTQFEILHTRALSHLLVKIMSFVYLGKTNEYENEL